MITRNKRTLAVAVFAASATSIPLEAAVEEVVVTARKTEESLQDVPLSVTALSSEEMRRASVITMQDVAQLTPGLTFQDLGSGTYQLPTIRGLAQTNIFAAENNVGIFIDGVYLSNKSGIDIQMLDLERLEVVRGPQSALFGRNSFAGAINYVTAKPSREFAGSLSATVGTDDWQEARLTVEGPIGSHWAGRIAVAGRSFDGTINNSYERSENVQGFDDTAVTISLSGNITEDLSARLFYYRGDESREQGGEVLLDNNCGTSSFGSASYYCGDLPSTDTVSLTPGSFGLERRTDLASLTLDWQLSEHWSLSSITAVNETDTRSFPDTDFTGGGVPFPTAEGSTLITNTWLSPGDPSSEDFSQELRLEYKDDTFRIMGGLYYYDGEERSITLGSVDTTNLAAGDRLLNPIAGILATDDPFGAPNPLLESVLSTESWAVFGLVSWELDPSLTLSAEFRYVEDERQIERPLVFFAPGASDDGDFSFVTPRFTLDYRFSDDVLLFASAAKGARSGGFNRLFSPLFPDEATFDEETNWTYELGIKSTWLDGSLRANATAFYVDWEDLQIQSQSQDDTSFAQPVRNVKGATSHGLELELSALFGEAWALGLGYAWAKPEFKNGSVDIGMSGACGVDNTICDFTVDGLPDISGNQLGRTHEHQLNANLTWSHSFDHGWESFARVDAFYVSEQPSRSINQQFVDERFLVNARVGLSKGNLELALWSSNLLDEDYAVSQNRQPRLPSSATLTNTILGQLRIVGLTGTYRF
jgi:iron complex outermembrane receptor protein